ncbi:MAG: aminoacyl-tRNA hydrolase [Epulopiscium sp. Nele67-Bin004]|nr:MAG: aminoacyl-tRNA hydrolase [Epulopiscium sp. Nele67-Bin004]
MKIVVGLGNPGLKYLGTRHNIGFDTVDYVAHHLNINMDKNKFKSIVGEGVVNGEKIILAKPQTYMNLSGEAVIQMLNWYKADVSDLLIIYDDISLEVAQLRIRKTGSAGGHNGIKSIISQIGTQDFPRLKIGIGQKPKQWDLADYVLGKFDDKEFDELKDKMPTIKEIVENFATKDIDTIMNRYNKKTGR